MFDKRVVVVSILGKKILIIDAQAYQIPIFNSHVSSRGYVTHEIFYGNLSTWTYNFDDAACRTTIRQAMSRNLSHNNKKLCRHFKL